ncbi:MAG: methyltransferase [Alphaproteobacteria bacterium HGW-Alphaproteobacteria-14]|nr:MAG: methyltransferase [Alphaproteobacteria bacterium HGW-Alphaproteobacteria-14]
MEHYHSSIRRDIVPLVPQARKLLDVGGGTGATARHLKEIGRVEEIGVMDAVVGSHCDGLDTWSTANLDDPDAVRNYLDEAGPFDVITLLDVLEHLADPWSAVGIFAQALRPGGVMIASIPNIRHVSVSARLLFCNRWDYADAGLLDRTHLRFFVKGTAIALMDRGGLAIERVEASPIGARRYKLANMLTLGLLRSLFTLQYFVVAKKDI